MIEWLKSIFVPASEAYQARTERKKAEKVAAIEADVAKLEANKQAIKEGRQADADWELASLKNSGWKDELWSLIFAIVFIGSFVPVMQDFVQVGIEQITAYPEWFRFLFSSIVLAAFGIRLWRRLG